MCSYYIVRPYYNDRYCQALLSFKERVAGIGR